MVLIALHLDVSPVVMADGTLHALLVLLVLLPLAVLVPTSADQPLLPRDWLLWTVSASATQDLEVATPRDLEGSVTWSYISNMKQTFPSFYYHTAMFIFLRKVLFRTKLESPGAVNSCLFHHILDAFFLLL